MEANDPAFPDNFYPGLTRRELFAAMAMQAQLSNPVTGQNYCKSKLSKEEQAAFISKNAVLAADALLAELAKHGGEP